MPYIECKFTIAPNAILSDVLIALLAELGFESFNEEYDAVLAYIDSDMYATIDESALSKLIEGIESVSCTKLEERNWNSEWESNYQSVLIANTCYVRAPFHEPKDVKYEIVIEPKMSFGTAHHETTALMLEAILNLDCKGKDILDMGCGTGVLAILASLMGAKQVTAIDFDQWSYENTIENFERNAISNGIVKHGDASILDNTIFDVIFANINRNILIQDMNKYVNVLKQEGLLLMSGFYEQDVTLITEKASQLNLKQLHVASKNNWTMAMFQKL